MAADNGPFGFGWHTGYGAHLVINARARLDVRADQFTGNAGAAQAYDVAGQLTTASASFSIPKSWHWLTHWGS